MTRQTRPDPLQPAERALADALAAATPPSGPSPGLDAAIFAAARRTAADRAGGSARAGEGTPAAATPSSTSTRAGHRRRRRSPIWLRGGALAATLVLAIGVAWQLRPQLEVVRLPEEAPVAAKMPALADDVSGAPASARRLHAPAEAAQAPRQPAPPVETEAAAAASQAPEAITPPSVSDAPAPPALFDAPSREPAAAREAATDSAGQELPRPAAKSARPAPREAAASAPVPMAMPAPPPAPPAPPAPAASRALQALPPPRPAPAQDAAMRTRAPDILGGAQAIDGEAMHDEDWLDQPLDDTPPASVDSPAVREAWLARIRELVVSERYGEARESFAEFRRRHPGAAVPDDLRTLLGEE
ncbi:hypothetical protein [Luteimonas sp. A649]